MIYFDDDDDDHDHDDDDDDGDGDGDGNGDSDDDYYYPCHDDAWARPTTPITKEGFPSLLLYEVLCRVLFRTQWF